jgi:N-acetylglucosamine kinase-like BadF-type ATPase
VAGVNTLFKPIEEVHANVQAMMTELLADLDGPVVAADLCLMGAKDVIREALLRRNGDCEVTFHSEPTVGLAACLKTEGVVALSGTGSDAFFQKWGQRFNAVGGWGPLLGDEGSGYDIGLNAIKAAIYSYDGRKEKSMLYELVMEHWELEQLWGIVTHLAGNPDARHEVASAAKLCSKAAHAGDKTALRIYEHAALEMSLQARTVIERNRPLWDGTVVIMGGAWKGHPRMFEVFKSEIELLYPEARVMLPTFEPVAGCAVLRCLQNGMDPDDVRNRLHTGFSKFAYEA